MQLEKSHPQITARGTVPLVVSVLGAGFTSGIIPAGLLPANVLNFENAYHLSHDQMGRMVGLCMIFGGGIGGLIGGWLCGKIGAIRNMLLALVMATFALCCIGLTKDYHTSIGGLLLYFFSMGFLASSNVLATVMLPDRQRGVGLLHAFNGVGKLIGPILASLFLYGAWRNSFLAVAALPVLLTIPLLLAHRDIDNSIGRKHDKSIRAGIPFWISVGGFGLIAGSEIAVALWIPTYARQARGFSAPQANLLLSIFLCGLVVGRFASSAFSKKLPPKRSIAFGVSCIIFAAPALYFPSYGLAGASFFLFGMAFSCTYPSYFAHLSTIFPEHLGLMGGASAFATQLGCAACAYIGGKLAVQNLSYPIIFGAAVMGVFALIFFTSPLARSTSGLD